MTRLPIDTRRRINLSKFLPKGNIHAVNAYKEGNKIILEPMVESESWLYENPKALKMIKKGIKEAKEGKLKDRPSYAEFADDEI